ncbi:hypothetical protein HCN44_005183 [Aphidius gifuensis]|uniref:EMI domain-containing protein n=1 Tax=Aphidius gifuensis TaxID=684658 RepID=A0A835CRI0_APHGI|nr:protein draper-like [Aphidius gifuensis]XP_044008037.1 protein draper-like [Aphidius gifuensis]KAF7992839.1 hypothetical protein HCN44_005183 [Aphidius gifuensis]
MAIKINLFLSTFCLTTIFLVSAVLEGPNVCVRQENYTVTVNISEQKPYKARTTTWCVAFPPKCSSYKTIVRTVYTTQVLQKQRPVEECCKGYGETATGDKCVPICSQDCKHGSCIAPDSCICEAGYGGSACDTKCPKGTWGSRCIHKCDCSNDTNCNPFDGKCDCTENCEDKYYSPNFSKGFCNCKNENYVCHPTDGCVCMYGYTGSTCEEPLFIATNVLQQKSESSYSGVFVAALFSACLAISILVAGLMYHRRRVADLKLEIAHVQYIAEPVISPDSNHFDNPVYSYQSSGKTDDGTINLLNNGLIRNNLCMKSVNTQKAKFDSFNNVDEDNATCKESYSNHNQTTSMKNKDADIGNPNINVYHSIDEMDTKKIINEPLYDEIKQNNNDFVYDHLDYARSSAWKPHYQRMFNGSNSSSSKDGSGSSKSSQHDLENGGP